MMAVGALECVWAVGYSAGCPTVGGPEEVEAICEWQGAKGSLCAAMVEAGFLDEESDGSLTIHDLYDHAPSYVQKRMKSEARRKAAGTTLSELRRDAATARWEKNRAKQKKNSSIQTDATGIHMNANGTPPTPKDAFPFASEGAVEKAPRKTSPHVAIFEEEARAAGLTPVVAKADAIQLADARKKFPDDDGYRAAVRRYLQLQDKFLVENRWAGRFIGSRLQALMNPGKTSDTAFPPTKAIGTKYANTPTVRI